MPYYQIIQEERYMAYQNNSKAKKVLGIIGTVIFFLSYIPFVWLPYAGIYGVQSGLFGGPFVYGFEAMDIYFLWLCIFPVYPVCVLYQLIFGIAYIRKHKILKIVTIVLAVCLAALVIGSGISYELKKQEKLNSERELIIDYLSDKYGEGVTRDITIRMTNYDDNEYRVTSPVLPDDGYFYVYTATADGFYDDLVNTYKRWDPTLLEDFDAYLNDLYDIPENMSLNSELDSVYFGDFTYGDDHDVLFESAEYRVTGIFVDEGDVTDDEVLEILDGVWEDQIPDLRDVITDGFFTLAIKENGNFAFYITIYPDFAQADISIYTGRGYQVYTGLNGERIDLD